jgi:hypothetical protein
MLSARRGCPATTTWNHWVLDVLLHCISILHNSLRASGVAWPKCNKGHSVSLLGITLSARHECPVGKIWNDWELDERFHNNSITYNSLCALDVVWPNCSTGHSVFLLCFMLSTRLGCPAATIWNHWELDVHLHCNSIAHSLLYAVDVNELFLGRPTHKTRIIFADWSLIVFCTSSSQRFQIADAGQLRQGQGRYWTCAK